MVDTRVVSIVSRATITYVLLFTSHPIGTYSTGEAPNPKLRLLSDENKKDVPFGYAHKPESPHFLAIRAQLLANVQPAQLRVWIDQLRQKAHKPSV